MTAVPSNAHPEHTSDARNSTVSSRRQFITGAFAAGAALVAAGCSATPSSPATTAEEAASSPTPPPTAAETTTVAAPSSTSPSSPDTLGTAAPSTTPWSGADFGELDRFLEQSNTHAFRIVEAGVLVHEWYRTDDRYVRDIASAQKSVLSLLVGRAIGDGLFTLDTPIDDVLGTAWTDHGQTAAITVSHLLSMTSGLNDRFDVVAAPGTEWRYSGAFAALFDVLTAVTGRELNHIADDWLFAPAGAGTAQFYERRTNEFAPIGLLASASDLTAIGQTAIDASQPGLPPAWLDDSFRPSQDFNDAYGLLWWLNGQSTFRLPGALLERSGALIPNAPRDLVAALGKDDQKLYVSRDLGLVVARLGDKASTEVRAALSTFDDLLWDLLMHLRGE